MNEPAHPHHLASSVTLTRNDIVSGLTELVAFLHEGGVPARVQVVGGAAIALTINSERTATRDVDAPLSPVAEVRAAAEKVARRRGWPHDWLNDEAAQFVPQGYGRAAEWTLIHEDDVVSIQVASAETLLAMKLHATQSRRLREVDDLMSLLPTCHVATVEEAEALYSDFYPGDEFTPSTAKIVRAVLDAGPTTPDIPPRPILGN